MKDSTTTPPPLDLAQFGSDHLAFQSAQVRDAWMVAMHGHKLPALLAECQRLRAENVRRANEYALKVCDLESNLEMQRAETRRQIEIGQRQRAEIERLRPLVEKMSRHTLYDFDGEVDGEDAAVVLNWHIRAARAALSWQEGA